LLGVPHDSDPHFSPDGDRLVFRSDAELGVDNIWVIPWESCNSAALRPDADLEQRVSLDAKLTDALANQAEDEMLLSSGVKETGSRKRRRLLREGRLHGDLVFDFSLVLCMTLYPAHRVTNETYRFITDARFHPSGNTVIACKWYTSARSIPAGEGWQYDVPDASDLYRNSDGLKYGVIRVGDGKRVISRNLAVGWSQEQYPDQQLGSEQFIWRGTDTVIYSKKPYQELSGIFEYSGGEGFHLFLALDNAQLDLQMFMRVYMESTLETSLLGRPRRW
jgi:WD40-like Beta Propeller Repeat